MFEYLEDDQSTWRYQKLPDIPKDFVEELTKIGGLNPFGQPMLRVVKGNEVKNDRAENQKLLKYHAGWTPFEVSGYNYEYNGQIHFTTQLENIPPEIMVYPTTKQEELGLLRYVVERWVSPEALEAAGRFQNRYAEGDIDPLLREFPREGIYDAYFIVENANNEFKLLGPEVLAYIRFRWHFEQKTLADQEKERERLLEIAEKNKKAMYDERLDAVIEGDIRLPKEEIERREWYWRTIHDYALDKGRI